MKPSTINQNFALKLWVSALKFRFRKENLSSNSPKAGAQYQYSQNNSQLSSPQICLISALNQLDAGSPGWKLVQKCVVLVQYIIIFLLLFPPPPALSSSSSSSSYCQASGRYMLTVFTSQSTYFYPICRYFGQLEGKAGTWIRCLLCIHAPSLVTCFTHFSML